MKPISRQLYPFASHTFDRGGGIRMHYVDEGPRDADPVVMVHGNPTWSFYYRGLVKALRATHRCIAVDHVGCGLSDKPGDDRYTYTAQSRVDDLEKLVESLNLDRPVTLVVHDWGGMIGMGWAATRSSSIARLVILNTAAFHLPQRKSFPAALRLTRTPLGALLVRGGNAFSGVASHVCVTRGRMPREVREAYVAPYDSWADRIATLRFVEDIPLAPGDPAYALVSRTADRLHEFAKTPTLICWGMRDFVFDHHFLEEWERRMPHAQVHRFEDCGHYVLEDAAEEITELVQTFVGGDAHQRAEAQAL